VMMSSDVYPPSTHKKRGQKKGKAVCKTSGSALVCACV
jgi:hypothetical protein